MKCLIYCTKSKDYHLDCEIVYAKNKWFCWDKKSDHYPFKYFKEELGNDYKETFNGHIVAQFDCEKVEIIHSVSLVGKAFECKETSKEDLLKKSCLDIFELHDYLQEKKGYAIHIKNLKIFDKPYNVNEFFQYRKYNTSLKNAPQNMCEVFDKNLNYYILISIRPEWVEKILNGEKTIEIRKKILRVLLRYL